MAITTCVLDANGQGAGLAPVSGNALKVTLPAGYSPKVGLAIVYQEATPSGIVYYGATSGVTPSGTGTSTDGVPIPTGGLAGAIPKEWLERGHTDVYLCATVSTPISLLLV